MFVHLLNQHNIKPTCKKKIHGIKTKEWIIAVQLEETFTKEEIAALYLNTVDFGSNAYGIKAASETFSCAAAHHRG